MPKQKAGTAVAMPKMQVDVRPSEKTIAFNPGSQFTVVDDCIPVFKEILPMKMRNQPVNLDSGYTLLSWEPTKPGGNDGILTVKSANGAVKMVRAFQKIIPLLDPTRWMKYKEISSDPYVWINQPGDALSPENKGYFDCLASSMISKLAATFKLPHFPEYYGAVRAFMDEYPYNMAEDIEEFRFLKWFWQGLDAGEFRIEVREKSTGRSLSKEEYESMLRPDTEFLHSEHSSEASDDSSDEGEEEGFGAEELPDIQVKETTADDCGLEDASIDTEEEVIEIKKQPGSSTPKTVHSLTTESTQPELEDEYDIHVYMKHMPVSILYLEHYEDTMDTLLEDEEFTPVSSNLHEVRWAAWLFQVCAALSQMQRHLNMTHNDLHTNNVLWKTTAVDYFYYKSTTGKVWRVPTFGKQFCIIDYGRAIFSVNNFYCISSDYNDGHDAAGMYNFGSIIDDTQPKVMPNKSFDLSRLACSLLRGLFPTTPTAKEKTKVVLTKEENLEIYETNHPLFNMIWSWLRMENGENVLETPEGDEKYPGFDLYIEIAKSADSARPEDQFNKKMFDVFLQKTGETTGPVLQLWL